MTLAKTVSMMMVAAISASTLTLSVSTSQAQAGRPHSDYINTQSHAPVAPPEKKFPKNTDPLAGRQGAGALYSDQTPQLVWFEIFDEYVWTLLPSEEDKSVLSRPINNELERVQDYIKVCNKISRNYRMLAANVRKLPVPSNSPGLAKYQSLKADFYIDMATVYEDLIRPRRTRTQEELSSQVKEIEERANQLKINSNNLLTMDMDLRRTFRVHQPKRTDALRRYVENK